eukprot:568214-Hanusia_phi.AAC.1
MEVGLEIQDGWGLANWMQKIFFGGKLKKEIEEYSDGLQREPSVFSGLGGGDGVGWGGVK